MTATLSSTALADINAALGLHPDTPTDLAVAMAQALRAEANGAAMVRAAAADLVDVVRVRRRAGWLKTPMPQVDALERALELTSVTAPRAEETPDA